MELCAPGRDPQRIAVIEGASGRVISEAELDAAAERLASAVAARRGELAFLFASNTPQFVCAYVALLRYGGAIALLEAALPAARKLDLIRRYRPALVLDCLPGFTELSAEDGAAFAAAYAAVPARSAGAAEVAAWRAVPAAAPDPAPHPDLCVLLSTSGSTGSPKLVRLSRRAIVENARSIAACLQIGPADRSITSLPPAYSYGLSVVNSYLFAGGTLVLTNESVMSRPFWQTFNQHACTSFSGVPMAYDMLVRLGIDRAPPPSLRTMTQAGGRLAVATAERFHRAMHERGGRFHVMYGQTEATARMSCLASEDFPAHKGSVGTAIPGGAFAIEQGEIVYRGPNVMLGYAEHAADLARGDDLGGVLHTGDLGHLDGDFLFVSGRSKRLAKIHGRRYNLDEVEAVLEPRCAAAAVAIEDKVIVFCEISGAQPAALGEWLAAALSLRKDAIEVRCVKAIPRNANGKPDYGRLQSEVDDATS